MRRAAAGRRPWTLVVAAAVIVLAGCSGSHGHPARRGPGETGTTRPPRPAASVDPAAAMTFALADAAPTNWNPLVAGGDADVAALVAANVLPSVFVTGPDYTQQLDTAFVTAASVTKTDPQTVVYHINPKAVWSDGQPITAADFVYNWQAQSGQDRFRDAGGAPFTPASTEGYSQIASVAETGNDPDTVTVTFSQPDPDWQSLFTDLVPAHVAQLVGFDQGFTDPVRDLLSGGPFLITSAVPGRSVTLVRNARYWANPASLSSVTIDFVPESGQLVTAFQRSELGGASVNPSNSAVSALRAMSNLKVTVSPSATWDDLVFNQSDPWLRDPKLRQAIMLAVNRTQMIAGTVGSYASVSPLGNRVFMPQAAGYHDNSGGQYNSGNLGQARSLLAQAGYSTTGGVLSKNGQTVTLRLAIGTVQAGGEQASLTAALGALGITTTMVPLPTGPPGPAPTGYDLAVVTRHASPNLAAVAADYGNPATVGTDNYSGADDSKVDLLLAQAATAASGSAEIQLYNKLDSTLWSDADSLPLFQEPAVTAFSSRYVGVVNNPTHGGATYAMADWGVPTSS